MRAEIGQRSIHFVQRGAGPIAILVHGFPLDSRLWAGQLTGLAGDRTLVALDLPGFGGSDSVGGGQMSMETLASDIDHLADHLGAETIDLVGLSMGGYVALAYADIFGHRLRSLALLNTRSGADDDQARANRTATAARVVAIGRAEFAGEMERALLAPGASQMARARLRTMVEATPYETIVAALSAMAERPDRTDVLESVTVPALVVTGEYDSIAPLSVAEDMASRLEDSRLMVIPGAGHLPPIEAPGKLNDVLGEHFARAG